MECQVKNDIKNLIKRIDKDDIPALAAELSYGLLVSFFPFLIFLITLVGFSELSSEEVLNGIKYILPRSAYELVYTTVIEVVDTQNGNMLSFGLIVTIWTSSTGFKAVIKGINKAYDAKEDRSFLKLLIISVISTFSLIFLIMVTLFLLVFGQILGNFLAKLLGYSIFFFRAWNMVRYLIILFSMVSIFAILYHYAPCKKLSWKEVIPGAVFATVGWIIVSLGFAFYVNNFGNYSSIYGSIGGIIILLTWIYFTSIIIIIGGEVNAVIKFDRKIDG